MNKIFRFILDILFPAYCFGCEKEGFYLCNKCFDKIFSYEKLPSSAFCFLCEKRLPENTVCKTCHSKTKIKRLFAPTSYEEKIIQSLIKGFKYNFILEIKKPLVQILIKYLNRLPDFQRINYEDYVLIPVPLSRKRLIWRGFNQAEILAKGISDELKIITRIDILKKIKEIKPQNELKGEERQENIKGVFACENTNIKVIKNKTVILVDDVKTTGATLEECANVLRKSGAKKVWAIVMAR